MRPILVLPCLLALGCSEYGFLGPGHQHDENPGFDPPPAPSTPAPDDTADPIPEGEVDCYLAPHIEVHELDLFRGTDFDDQGRLLYAAPNGLGDDDVIGVWPDGSWEVVAASVSSPRRPMWPRFLPDGNLTYVSVSDGTPGPDNVGMYDPTLGEEVALTSPVQGVSAIEPDVDGTVYAFHQGDYPVADHLGPEVRRYNLYTGSSHTLVRFEVDFVGQDLALSPSSETLYVAGRYPYDKERGGTVYAVQRLGPWDWGDPVEIWSGDEVFGIAVDACNNLYISEGTSLLILAHGSDQVQHVVDLPGGLQQPVWGSGVGDWPSNVLFGWWINPSKVKDGFAGIELGVDGTHILTR